MSAKRLKRISKSAAEYEGQVAESSVSAVLVSKLDEELFTMDRRGSKSKRQLIRKENELLRDGKISKTETKLISRAIKKLKEQELPVSEQKSMDIWENDGSKGAKKGAKMKVALPGQSYNPTSDAHQVVVAKAVNAIEKQAAKHRVEPSTTDITNLFLRDDSDDEYDHADDNSAGTQALHKKKSEKLTRAQRNKIRTRNVSVDLIRKQQQSKSLVKSINNLPEIVSSINSEEKVRLERKRKFEESKKQESEDMTYLEAGNVPLSDELNGSLRKVIPKGVAIADRVASMRERGDLMRPDRRKRRGHERPHAPKKVVWTPKYKFNPLE